MAATLDEFWKFLDEGGDGITDLPEPRRQQIDAYLKYLNVLQEYSFSKGAYFPCIDTFDYRFFHMKRQDAVHIHPAQRLFLQCSWGAIEDSGYNPEHFKGSKTGVYVGYSGDDTYQRMGIDIEGKWKPSLLLGNKSSAISGRVSYYLDLRGPSVVVDTACSSSLVAVHLACQGIIAGDCEMAIAGGVNLSLLKLAGIGEIGIESSDGKARTFDDRAKGTGFGEGAAAILLMPLENAYKGRNHIYAVIKGSAINQDGRSIGLTSPNVDAQAEVIVKAWEDAEIDPFTISYMEAHGTGTKLGDPIEIEGIRKAFEKFGNRKQFCAIGSLKPNIGHLYEAAGIASLIKVALQLKNRTIVPSIHFQTPSRRIDFIRSPVYVNDRSIDWECTDFPRRAGISAFGTSGTNCHVVVEEAPYTKYIAENLFNDQMPMVLTLSTMSDELLREMIKRFSNFLEQRRDICLQDLSFTSSVGRSHFGKRLAIIYYNKQDLIRKFNLLDLELKTDRKNYIFLREETNNAQKDNIDRNQSMKANDWLNDHVKKKIKGIQELDSLVNACIEYVSGENLNWKILYQHESRKRMSLPTYSFAQDQCWYDYPIGDKEKSISYKLPLPSPDRQLNYKETKRNVLLSACMLGAVSFQNRNEDMEDYERKVAKAYDELVSMYIEQGEIIDDRTTKVALQYLNMILEGKKATPDEITYRYEQISRIREELEKK
jgi:acyl transferase domain-containing protein